jgi:hypothetical protein
MMYNESVLIHTRHHTRCARYIANEAHRSPKEAVTCSELDRRTIQDTQAVSSAIGKALT